MPRLREVPSAEVQNPDVRQMYTMMFGDRNPVAEPGTVTGTPGTWYTVWANNPDTLSDIATIQLPIIAGLQPVVRELVMARTGFAVGSQFVYSQHRKGARAAGLADDKMDDIVAWASSDKFDQDERTLLAYVDEIVLAGGRVQDATMDRMKRQFSDREILDITFLTCLYVLHGTMCKALRLEYDDVDERIVEVPVPGDAENGGPNERRAMAAAQARMNPEPSD